MKEKTKAKILGLLLGLMPGGILVAYYLFWRERKKYKIFHCPLCHVDSLVYKEDAEKYLNNI